MATKPKHDNAKRSRFRSIRARAALALIVVGLLGWAGHGLWRRAAPFVVRSDRFLVPAERITMNDAPVWIVGDVRQKIIRDAGLEGRLSILDDQFAQRIRDAFLLNPWIESIDQIQKLTPAGVAVNVTYRKPVAVVELPSATTRRLVPIDRRATHLPELDVPENRRQWLPRIVGVVGEPPVGQVWDDPRVAGAVELAVRLESQWDSLYLSEIVPSARPVIRGGARFFDYELVTRGGTRVVWGAAPSVEAPGEAVFETKLQRLSEGIERTGPLNTVRGPKIVNVRDGLLITPRSARKPPSPTQPETSMR